MSSNLVFIISFILFTEGRIELSPLLIDFNCLLLLSGCKILRENSFLGNTWCMGLERVIGHMTVECLNHKAYNHLVLVWTTVWALCSKEGWALLVTED